MFIEWYILLSMYLHVLFCLNKLIQKMFDCLFRFGRYLINKVLMFCIRIMLTALVFYRKNTWFFVSFVHTFLLDKFCFQTPGQVLIPTQSQICRCVQFVTEPRLRPITWPATWEHTRARSRTAVRNVAMKVHGETPWTDTSRDVKKNRP